MIRSSLSEWTIRIVIVVFSNLTVNGSVSCSIILEVEMLCCSNDRWKNLFRLIGNIENF